MKTETRQVISKSKKKKGGAQTEMVIYKTETSPGKYSSRTKHEQVRESR